MYLRLLTPALLFSIILGLGSCKQQGPAPDSRLMQNIGKNFTDAAAQYHVLMSALPADSFPRSYFPGTGEYLFSNSGWWCSGFYPGTLINLYEETGDTSLYREAKRMLAMLEREKYNQGTHDLGFMIYCSFGNANRISPDTAWQSVMVTAAHSLATRFNEKTGCIKSWDSKPGDFLVIIDNMMNLELLFEASKMSGDNRLRDIAITHANTTMKNHFRPDYSSWHVLNYDPGTGEIKEKKTAQGAADESAWARGQAWGLYGYTVTYRETKDKKYLDQARHIASFLLHHPNLPADKIPYWDFNAPGIPNTLRDASAAAIMASALIELSGYVGHSEATQYMNVVDTILTTLSGPAYKASTGSNGGFILEHSVGHFPANSEVDVPLSYADYYFIEAMRRYRDFFKSK